MTENKISVSLKEAVISGVCAGGFACSYYGGTYFEEKTGEKKQKVDSLIKAYKQDLRI